MTVAQAKRLTPGMILYHLGNRNADGSAQRWKVNGKVKTWKRDLNRVSVPLKHGLYSYGTATEHDIGLLCLTDPTEK